MSYDWEDWEVDNLVLKKTDEQLKRLNERKLVEESDIALTKELFNSNMNEINNLEKINNYYTIRKDNTNKKNEKIINQKNLTQKKNSNKEKNELKQKILSNYLKEEKAKKEREIELFGESEYDFKYSEYEDKYY